MKQNANAVTKAIEAYLRYQVKAFAWRQNNTGVYRPKLKRWTGGNLKGVPDVCGIMPDGRFIGVEVKVGRDRLSIHQENFQEQTQQRGGIYIVARSFEDFENKFQQVWD